MEKMLKVKYEVKRSEKSGRVYAWAFIDLGYRKVKVSFDQGEIAEIMGIDVGKVYTDIANFKD